MGGFLAGLKQSLAAYAVLIKLFLNLWPSLKSFLRAIIRTICRCCSRTPHEKCGIKVPPSEHKRADPLIYCQSYLMAQGLSVTWDNPDIQLFRNGVPVGSGLLDPGTEYEVEVRVWNGSYDAPAVGLPVELSFMSFGAGNPTTFVGTDIIDLGAKATANCPAFARFKWITPVAEGHYCLQARLVWADDANPDNNLGQENTNVGKTQSPANFTFRFRNEAGERRRIDFETDSYALRKMPECPPDPPRGRAPARPRSRRAESEQRWKAARAQHSRGAVPVSDGWTVTITPEMAELEAWSDMEVKVAIDPPAQGFEGRNTFNIACFATTGRGVRSPAGGVTLYVERG